MVVADGNGLPSYEAVGSKSVFLLLSAGNDAHLSVVDRSSLAKVIVIVGKWNVVLHGWIITGAWLSVMSGILSFIDLFAFLHLFYGVLIDF